jgi:histidine triad (HIT) family protein
VTDCVFCRIASGELPADVVTTTDRTVAFRDLNPQAPTHVLVIPRDHITNAATVEPGDGAVLAEMLATARSVAEQDGVIEGGYRLVLNVGDDAGNTVPHLHLHVIGGRSMSWPPG